MGSAIVTEDGEERVRNGTLVSGWGDGLSQCIGARVADHLRRTVISCSNRREAVCSVWMLLGFVVGHCGLCSVSAPPSSDISTFKFYRTSDLLPPAAPLPPATSGRPPLHRCGPTKLAIAAIWHCRTHRYLPLSATALASLQPAVPSTFCQHCHLLLYRALVSPSPHHGRVEN